MSVERPNVGSNRDSCLNAAFYLAGRRIDTLTGGQLTDLWRLMQAGYLFTRHGYVLLTRP